MVSDTTYRIDTNHLVAELRESHARKPHRDKARDLDDL
jgi:hypothetical protein